MGVELRDLQFCVKEQVGKEEKGVKGRVFKVVGESIINDWKKLIRESMKIVGGDGCPGLRKTMHIVKWGKDKPEGGQQSFVRGGKMCGGGSKAQVASEKLEEMLPKGHFNDAEEKERVTTRERKGDEEKYELEHVRIRGASGFSWLVSHAKKPLTISAKGGGFIISGLTWRGWEEVS